jgi:heme/copper-type cytochrome/quinol oxidase subunit 3
MADTAIHESIAAESEHGVPGHATSTGISNEKLAMWVFLGSDCLLFGALISTYLLLRHRSISGPVELRDPANIFDIPFTSVSSFVLLFSSLTMALAVGAIHSPPPCWARCSSAARSTSSPASCTRGWVTPPTS